jgi:hypothetical protein
LIFNQEMRGFESHTPCQSIADLQLPIADFNCQFRLVQAIGNLKSTLFMWVVAQLAEHRTVTATVEGSTPFDPPNSLPIFGLPIADWSARLNYSAGGTNEHCRRQSTIGN